MSAAGATSSGSAATTAHKRFAWQRIALHAFLVLASAVMLLPFLWMVSTSLKDAPQVFTYPPTWIPDPIVWENYWEALTVMPFHIFYFNSTFVAVSVTLLQLLTASLAAFAFARLRFPGRDALFLLYLAALMIPFPVLLIPQFIMVRFLGWYDTYWALIIPQGFFSAFSTFLMRQYFRGIPIELDDAARMDGASSWRIWWQIVLPVSTPVLAALAIFIFLGSWNEFLWPLVVTNSENMRTIPVALAAFQGQFSTDWQLLMAAAVVAMLPILVVFVLAQRQFIEGITVTGLGGR
jgi:multiple sugar transport system permease protein